MFRFQKRGTLKLEVHNRGLLRERSWGSHIMSYQSISQSEPAVVRPVRVDHAHAHQTDMIASYGGNVFGFADIIADKLAKLLTELTDDDCTLLLCGLFFQPCMIAQALEETGENWWFTCVTVTFAPNFFGLPYLCFTVPAMNRLNVRLGGEPMSVRNAICLCLCRPCVACQLARAVKEAKRDGVLAAPSTSAFGAGPGAPTVEVIERL